MRAIFSNDYTFFYFLEEEKVVFVGIVAVLDFGRMRYDGTPARRLFLLTPGHPPVKPSRLRKDLRL
jgi:hypothetical protein